MGELQRRNRPALLLFQEKSEGCEMNTHTVPTPKPDPGPGPLFNPRTQGVSTQWPTKLELEFAKFHQENPKFYALFVQYAMDVREAGFQQFSARAIIHRIRWHMDIETKSGDGFKINNNHSPYYARKMMREYPEVKDFFSLRKTGAEK